MKQAIRHKVHDARGILADVSIAQNHPSTKEKPAPGSRITLRLMHSLHTALLASGKLANRSYERKNPHWPLKSESINVLGYGAEKVVYRVNSSDHSSDRVVSIYHMESLGNKDPLEVVKKKQERYETYKKYFGDLVVPTSFVVLDNPWGDGSKPASIQPLIQNAQKFSELSQTDLEHRAKNDGEFATSLNQLVGGYQKMLDDNLSPDFASSNLLISGSKIVIFDTGWIYTAEKANQLALRHSNYETLGSLVDNHSLTASG